MGGRVFCLDALCPNPIVENFSIQDFQASIFNRPESKADTAVSTDNDGSPKIVNANSMLCKRAVSHELSKRISAGNFRH